MSSGSSLFPPASSAFFYYTIFLGCWEDLISVSLEFVIALPDHTAIFAVGMPDFCPEEISAVSADKPGRKYALSIVLPPQVLSPQQFYLNQFKFIRRNDRIMTLLNVILIVPFALDLIITFILSRMNVEKAKNADRIQTSSHNIKLCDILYIKVRQTQSKVLHRQA